MRPLPEQLFAPEKLPEFPGRLTGILSTYGFTEGTFVDTFLKFRKIMKKNGFKATVTITGSLLQQHPNFVKKFKRNIEFALYGHFHTNYSRVPFETVEKHLTSSANLFSKYNLKPRGFRAPMLLWNDKIIDAMPSFDYYYESNEPIIWDNVIKVKKKNRNEISKYYAVKSAKKIPSLPTFDKGIVKLPVSLPDDQLLYHVWNIRDKNLMSRFFHSMLNSAYNRGELVNYDFHFDYFQEWYKPLDDLVETAKKKEPKVWLASLEEISKWWFERSKFIFDMKERKDGYEIISDCPNYSTILIRGAGTDVKTEPWFGRYKIVKKNHFMIKCARIPGIGVAPGTPTKLIEFLKSEGFIVDESTGRDRFAIYIDDIYRFDRNDGDCLKILKMIENIYAPLVRLWRWPFGSRCAMSVTADIEAITLGDFLRRKK